MKNKFLATLIALSLFAFAVPPAKAAGGNVIENGKKVTLAYSMESDGKVIQTVTKDHPFEYIHGEQRIIPGLQKGLEGMKAGETKKITVEPSDGFGNPDPKAVAEIPKTSLPAGEVKPGSVLTATSPNGQTMRTIVKEIKKDTVVIDFNHPLAGKTVIFDVEVLDVSKK